MFNHDRKFIENKYHKTDEPFNPYARMAYHGYGYDKSTGLEDEEIRDGLAKLYEKTKDLPHPVAKAYAVKYVLENTKKGRWYDLDGTLRTAISLLQNCPESTRHEIAKQMAKNVIEIIKKDEDEDETEE